MKRAILSALLSHWRRRPFQFLTLILGLALATALWSGVQAINAEARTSYDAASRVLGGGGTAHLSDPTGAPIPPEVFANLRRAGWRVSPVIDGWISGGSGRVRLLGNDPLTAPPGTATTTSLGSVDIREFLTPPGLILTAPAVAG